MSTFFSALFTLYILYVIIGVTAFGYFSARERACRRLLWAVVFALAGANLAFTGLLGSGPLLLAVAGGTWCGAPPAPSL
jgi:hypothetical protein